MSIVCFLVALFACTIGSICGMGGGVIIKPVLDSLNIFPVATINFMSGCTVLCMSAWSVLQVMVKKESAIELKTSTYLAISAAIGGLTGKTLYSMVAALFPDPNTAGGVQACILLVATFLTFLYTINKAKFSSKHVTNPLGCLAIGFILGNLGSFLGIGGGPFNVAVLYFFFSMNTKQAAQNSLYIIVFSQAMGIVRTAVTGSIPSVNILILLGMVICGVLGSTLGRKINKKLNEKGATLLFEGAMLLVMLINVYNIIRFFG